jgi:hypothetical protein
MAVEGAARSHGPKAYRGERCALLTHGPKA